MNVLVVDIGGTHVKLLATGQDTHQQFDSGPTLTPETMVSQVRKVASDWNYDVVSIGYPGPVLHGRIVSEPHNLGTGWVAFNFEAAFKRPVKVVNDAAMQALGSYKGRGKMLFLGLGTGLGSTMIVDGIVENPWNWDIFLTKRARSRITLGSVDWRSTARKNGNAMSLTWSSASSPPSNPMKLCWAAET